MTLVERGALAALRDVEEWAKNCIGDGIAETGLDIPVAWIGAQAIIHSLLAYVATQIEMTDSRGQG